jgi:Ca2+-binding EF-hand superfamily protein
MRSRGHKGEGFLRAKYTAWFTLLDRDGDGTLSREDFLEQGRVLQAHLGQVPGRPSSAVDAVCDFWASLSSLVDENGDGRVSHDEFVGYHLTLARDVASGRGLPKYVIDPLLRLFVALDHDGDGTVSFQEYAAYLLSIRSPADPRLAFERLDLDGDGQVSLEEVEEHFLTWVGSTDFEAAGNLLMTGTVPPALD